jgi:glucosamine-6-phosphate deaminase
MPGQSSASTYSERTYDQLRVLTFADQQSLATTAAGHAARIIAAAVAAKGEANVMVATGNAALQFMAALRRRSDIDWSRVNLFHLDEYAGISDQHPASFRLFIRQNLADHVKPKAAFYLEGDAPDAAAECRRYAELVRQHPIDLCHCGIGENGHLAFNDPPVANFNDPLLVKVVELDAGCRRQQVGEGHFTSLADVPTHALSLTIPGLLAAKQVIAVVPETRKAQAVHDALLGPIATTCPASILRRQPHAVLYLDRDSAAQL